MVIGWLKRELDRCLMDRAFRMLHERIDDKEGQIRNLISARERMAKQYKENEQVILAVNKKDKEHTKKAQSELDRQLNVNRILKSKHYIESQRQAAIIQQLRDLVDPVTFIKICEDVTGRPDKEFARAE